MIADPHYGQKNEGEATPVPEQEKGVQKSKVGKYPELPRGPMGAPLGPPWGWPQAHFDVVVRKK